MNKNSVRKIKHNKKQLPVIVEKTDRFYVVECPVFEGCYTQGKTLAEALKNIREVIDLVLEEKINRDLLRSYHPRAVTLHTISL